MSRQSSTRTLKSLYSQQAREATACCTPRLSISLDVCRFKYFREKM